MSLFDGEITGFLMTFDFPLNEGVQSFSKMLYFLCRHCTPKATVKGPNSQPHSGIL